LKLPRRVATPENDRLHIYSLWENQPYLYILIGNKKGEIQERPGIQRKTRDVRKSRNRAPGLILIITRPRFAPCSTHPWKIRLTQGSLPSWSKSKRAQEWPSGLLSQIPALM
jgi:hypothetical protein